MKSNKFTRNTEKKNLGTAVGFWLCHDGINRSSFVRALTHYAYTLRNAHEAVSDSCRGKTVENLQTYKYYQYVFYGKRNFQK